MSNDKMNGYFSILRLITPVLLALALFILGAVREDMRELKTHFTNHLSEYNRHCLVLEGRLKAIETEIKFKR